jgi:Uma2 family endonuclease
VDALLTVDAETPRSLVLDPPLTDAQFQEFCFANDWFQFERTREGEILMHPPRGGFTSAGNAEITAGRQLLYPARRSREVAPSKASP